MTVPDLAGARLPGPGDVLLGRFTIESLVGEGGMGAVFRARHAVLDQTVAFKVLSPEASKHPEAVPRFLNEARAITQLVSDHVVRVFDVGTLESGLPFMMMELLQGKDLGTIVENQKREGGRLPVTSVVDWVVQACDAVAEAHSLGMVHRDLKPQNLFLSNRPDGRSVVKVLDFGISKSTDDPKKAMTATNAFLGSPHYMPPEQLKSARDVDARADIWAFGAVLYELFVGRPPFDGASFVTIYLQVTTEEPPAIRDTRSDVPPPLAEVVMRCLRKDRADRYPNVSELVRALAPFGSRETAERAERILTRYRASTSGPAHDSKRNLGATLVMGNGVVPPPMSTPRQLIGRRSHPDSESSQPAAPPLPPAPHATGQAGSSSAFGPPGQASAPNSAGGYGGSPANVLLNGPHTVPALPARARAAPSSPHAAVAAPPPSRPMIAIVIGLIAAVLLVVLVAAIVILARAR